MLASSSRVALSFTPPPCVCAFHSFATKDELGKAAPRLLTPGLMGESSEDEGQREYQANDSDSDGPILYTDDDDDEEDEDEDGSGESKTFHSDIKESACNAGDPGSIPGLGRSSGKGSGYPLQ